MVDLSVGELLEAPRNVVSPMDSEPWSVATLFPHASPLRLVC